MTKPLRVLQVVGKMDRAGAETLLMNLYRHIDRDQVQFDFLTHRQEEGDYDAEIASLGGKVYHLCPMSIGNSLRYPTQLKAFFQEKPSYRIIHSHIDAMSLFPLAGAKAVGISVRIAHSHNTAFPKDATYPLRLCAKTLLPFQATHYFCCSQAAARFLFPASIVEEGRCMLLPNAIKLDRFTFSPEIRDRVRRELGINEKTFVIGHVGRFSVQKNHKKLFRIFAALRQQNPDSVLLLVGKGELREELYSLCAQLGLQSAVRFLGVRDDVEQLMQAFDLFLLPSFYEGFPVVGVEAQAAGLPCLMSDRITRDAALTSNVVFMPLETEDELWARQALALRKLPRGNQKSQLTDKGFDIERQAEFLNKFYLTVEGV